MGCVLGEKETGCVPKKGSPERHTNYDFIVTFQEEVSGTPSLSRPFFLSFGVGYMYSLSVFACRFPMDGRFGASCFCFRVLLR